eukprot:6195784-Pleurochrysis_carterae.AAC.2
MGCKLAGIRQNVTRVRPPLSEPVLCLPLQLCTPAHYVEAPRHSGSIREEAGRRLEGEYLPCLHEQADKVDDEDDDARERHKEHLGAVF